MSVGRSGVGLAFVPFLPFLPFLPVLPDSPLQNERAERKEGRRHGAGDAREPSAEQDGHDRDAGQE